MIRILGAIIAGGQSRRFGADKALARFRGMSLIDHVTLRLEPQVAAVAVCGREMPGRISLPDRPGPGLGPLAGVNAALAYAHAAGFDAVVSVPCDAPDLPSDLVDRLGASNAATFVAGLPVIGFWPSALAARLDAYLTASQDRSMRGAAKALGAAPIDIAVANVNTRADLAQLAGRPE